MYENKQGFINDFQEALIKNGARRYDYLMDTPFSYVVENGLEVLEFDGIKFNVSGDSLAAIANTMSSVL